MRFHIPALPHTRVSKEYCHCAYTQKVLNFKVMMEARGHEVCVYESDEPLSPGDNLSLTWDANDPLWKRQNTRMIALIQKKIEPRDFVLIIGGLCQKPIADAFQDHIVCEFGVGYYGIFAKFCVFESAFHQAVVYGRQGWANGRFFDAVIPNYYDVRDYPFVDVPSKYALFVGRLNDDKGIHVAADAARLAGLPLVVAGQGTPPKGTHFVGRVNVFERGEWMSNATALLAPSLYLEPFGGVATEAQLCGTPAVTTPWGGFIETVEDWKTGFRCHTLGEFVEALQKAPGLDRAHVRERAVSNYSLEAVGIQYDRYFQRLSLLWEDGWNSVDN